MKRWVIIIGSIAALILLAVAAAIATLNSTDWREYEEPIAAAVFDVTGRRLSFDGELFVKIGLSPSITANTVSFQNASWGSAEDMVTMSSLVLRIRLLPLIFGNVKIRRAELIGLNLLLETNADGRGNWLFDTPTSSVDTPTEADDAGSEASGDLALTTFVKLAVIKNARVRYLDGVSGDSHLFQIEEMRATSKNETSPLTIDLAGSYGDEPITVSGQLGHISKVLMGSPLDVNAQISALGANIVLEGSIEQPLTGSGIDLRGAVSGQSLSRLAEYSGNPTPDLGRYEFGLTATGSEEHLRLTDISVDLVVAGARVQASGSIDNAVAVDGIDMNLSVEGDTPARFSGLAETDLPDLGPFKLALHFGGNLSEFTVDNLALDMADMQLRGAVKGYLAGERPRVEANLASPAIDLVSLQAKLAPGAQSPQAQASGDGGSQPADGRIFPKDPLPFGELTALDTVDAKLEIKVDQLVASADLTLSDVHLALDAMTPRRATIDPLRLKVMGGTIDGALSVDISGQTPRIKSNMHMEHPDAGALAKSQGSDVITKGPMELEFDITGAGGSVREIMASLSGRFNLEMGVATIHDEWVGRVTAGLNSVVKKTADNQKADLNCVVAQFDISRGIATASSLIIDMPRLALIGDGTINLGSEAIELDFGRDAAGASVSGALPPFRVRGSLAEPAGSVDSGALASKAVGLGASLVTGRAGRGRGVTIRSGPKRCHQVIAAYRKKQENEAEAKKVAADSVKKAGSVTKNATKSAFGKVKGWFTRDEKKGAQAPPR